MKKILGTVFFTFFMSGFVSVLMGSIMPYIIEDYQISYLHVGKAMALLSTGNLFATFFTGYLVKLLGRRRASVLLSMLTSIGFLMIICLPREEILMVSFFMIGITRGSISNLNNSVVNNMDKGKSRWLNYLHMFYSLGAFLSPIFVVILMTLGFEWKEVLLILLFFPLTGSVLYSRIPDQENQEKNKGEKKCETPYYRQSLFWLCCIVLFFYVGAENALSGWLVLYLKDGLFMPDNYAQSILSLLYFIMAAGRLIGGYVSAKLQKTTLLLLSSVGAATMFLLFIFSTGYLYVSIAIIGIGLCFAPIYPTIIAVCGQVIDKEGIGMGAFLTIGGIGKMLITYLVGAIASGYDIHVGMFFMLFELLFLLMGSLILKLWEKYKLKKTWLLTN